VAQALLLAASATRAEAVFRGFRRASTIVSMRQTESPRHILFLSAAYLNAYRATGSAAYSQFARLSLLGAGILASTSTSRALCGRVDCFRVRRDPAPTTGGRQRGSHLGDADDMAK
jgi:hypothetical protein